MAGLRNLHPIFEELFQADTLVPHLGGRELQPRRLEFHAPYTDRIGGDWYVVCSTCGWVSLALASEPSRLVCPVGEAESEGRRNRAAIHRARV